jgi:hypothetical protein
MAVERRGVNVERDGSGRLPAYAWPGGYPLCYPTMDGEVLCSECANMPETHEHHCGMSRCPDNDGSWCLAGVMVRYEGEMDCANCGAAIPSAYEG